MLALTNVATSWDGTTFTLTANTSDQTWGQISRRVTLGDFSNPNFIRNMMITDQGIIINKAATAFGIPFGVAYQIAYTIINGLTWTPVVTVADKSVAYGAGTTITATVSSELSISSYLWQYSTDGGSTWTNAAGGTYSGGTSITLTIGTVTGLNGYKFQCIVTNANGSGVNSPPMTLTVVPAISSQPSNQSVTHPATATFSVTASGTATLTYQWQLSGDGGTTWGNVSTGTGGTTNSYITAATATTDNGKKYRVVIKDGNNQSTNSNSATLTVS